MNTEPKYLQVVYTRFSGPKVRGSKIVASVPTRRTKVNRAYDHALSAEKNHEMAAWKAIAHKFGSQAPDSDGSRYKLVGTIDPPNMVGMAFVFERIDAQEI